MSTRTAAEAVDVNAKQIEASIVIIKINEIICARVRAGFKGFMFVSSLYLLVYFDW